MSFADLDRTPFAEHATLVFEREISAPVHDVFAAFADAGLRARWAAPSDTAIVIYDAADFREGGEDRYRCGSRQNPDIHGTTRYLEIVENSRIVSCETIALNGRRLCASLTTVELRAQPSRTRLRSTTQLSSFIGAAMVQGHTDGHNGALDNLVRWFQKERPAV